MSLPVPRSWLGISELLQPLGQGVECLGEPNRFGLGFDENGSGIKTANRSSGFTEADAGKVGRCAGKSYERRSGPYFGDQQWSPGSCAFHLCCRDER